MLKNLVLLSTLFLSAEALAGSIAVIDFQRAVTETNEGKDAQERLDAMYGSKKEELSKMEQELKTEMEDYQARAMILSEDARAEAEQSLVAKQQRFQQTAMQYESEMQQTYYTLLQDLDTKMRALSEKIAKDKGYDLVVDRAAVVYFGGETIDMTDELITAYNTQ